MPHTIKVSSVLSAVFLAALSACGSPKTDHQEQSNIMPESAGNFVTFENLRVPATLESNQRYLVTGTVYCPLPASAKDCLNAVAKNIADETKSNPGKLFRDIIPTDDLNSAASRSFTELEMISKGQYDPANLLFTIGHAKKVDISNQSEKTYSERVLHTRCIHTMCPTGREF